MKKRVCSSTLTIVGVRRWLVTLLAFSGVHQPNVWISLLCYSKFIRNPTLVNAKALTLTVDSKVLRGRR